MSTRGRQQRPACGISMHEALKRYSDPVAYAAMEAARMEGNENWQRQHDALASVFAKKLALGVVVASAIPEHDGRREVIHKMDWECLVIDYDYERIVGAEHYVEAEFFEPSAIPENIPIIPHWLSFAAGMATPDFVHDDSYENVTLCGKAYRLGPKQAHIVKALHGASGTSNVWRKGRDLLDDAESETTHISDLFKNHRGLIESDRRGKYRLNLPKS